VVAEAHLNGLDSFQGSTSVTGHGYMPYADEARRRDKAACLIETWNVGLLRPEPGKWRQVLHLRLVIEDLPDDDNRVELAGDVPRAAFARHSDYALRAVRDLQSDLEHVLSPLPLERIIVTPTTEPTESHILGTTVMGRDAGDGVVDRDCVHHAVRNLVVLGGSVFPSGAPAIVTSIVLKGVSDVAPKKVGAGDGVGLQPDPGELCPKDEIFSASVSRVQTTS